MEANLSSLISSRYQAPRSDSPRQSEHSETQLNRDHAKPFQNDTVSISQSAQLAYSQSQSRESNIEILTRDGDKVTISLSTNDSFQTGFSYSDFQSQNVSLTELSAYSSQQSSSQFRISIEGRLDADEREAIENLVNEISDVANKLYDGDIKSAFKEANSIEYDTDELQAYSFDITQTRNRQFTAAYEEVATYRPSSELSNQNNSFDLFDKLQELAENAVKELDDLLVPKQIEKLISSAYDFLEANREIDDKDNPYEFDIDSEEENDN